MLAYVGLTRPYRFERAIVALVALFLAIAAVAAAGWLVAVHDLTTFGPRAFYFLYLLALCVLVVALVRWPRLAGALLILALVDFGWGVGSFSLRHSALGGASLLPPDKSEPQRFQWHALLQAVPIPSLRIPPDSFGDADFVDNGHFSIQSARRFAADLAPVVRDAYR